MEECIIYFQDTEPQMTLDQLQSRTRQVEAGLVEAAAW